MRLALLALASLPIAGAAVAGEAKCCFTNSGYSGVCEVTPAKDETCQGILAYLNTPNTVGKGYCGGTDIRGGWELAACKAAPQGESAVLQEPEASSRPPAARETAATWLR